MSRVTITTVRRLSQFEYTIISHTKEGNILTGGATVVSPMSASVWKITCNPGDLITSADEIVMVLEAMKTEVGIPAGDENVGRKIKGVGKGIKEGTVVLPGDVLMLLE
jgi:biotin carboxyl carrier protein